MAKYIVEFIQQKLYKLNNKTPPRNTSPMKNVYRIYCCRGITIQLQLHNIHQVNYSLPVGCSERDMQTKKLCVMRKSQPKIMFKMNASVTHDHLGKMPSLTSSTPTAIILHKHTCSALFHFLLSSLFQRKGQKVNTDPSSDKAPKPNNLWKLAKNCSISVFSKKHITLRNVHNYKRQWKIEGRAF